MVLGMSGVALLFAVASTVTLAVTATLATAGLVLIPVLITGLALMTTRFLLKQKKKYRDLERSISEEKLKNDQRKASQRDQRVQRTTPKSTQSRSRSRKPTNRKPLEGEKTRLDPIMEDEKSIVGEVGDAANRRVSIDRSSLGKGEEPTGPVDLDEALVAWTTEQKTKATYESVHDNEDTLREDQKSLAPTDQNFVSRLDFNKPSTFLEILNSGIESYGPSDEETDSLSEDEENIINSDPGILIPNNVELKGSNSLLQVESFSSHTSEDMGDNDSDILSVDSRDKEELTMANLSRFAQQSMGKISSKSREESKNKGDKKIEQEDSFYDFSSSDDEKSKNEDTRTMRLEDLKKKTQEKTLEKPKSYFPKSGITIEKFVNKKRFTNTRRKVLSH